MFRFPNATTGFLMWQLPSLESSSAPYSRSQHTFSGSTSSTNPEPPTLRPLCSLKTASGPAKSVPSASPSASSSLPGHLAKGTHPIPFPRTTEKNAENNVAASTGSSPSSVLASSPPASISPSSPSSTTSASRTHSTLPVSLQATPSFGARLVARCLWLRRACCRIWASDGHRAHWASYPSCWCHCRLFWNV